MLGCSLHARCVAVGSKSPARPSGYVRAASEDLRFVRGALLGCAISGAMWVAILKTAAALAG